MDAENALAREHALSLGEFHMILLVTMTRRILGDIVPFKSKQHSGFKRYTELGYASEMVLASSMSLGLWLAQ